MEPAPPEDHPQNGSYGKNECPSQEQGETDTRAGIARRKAGGNGRKREGC
ncbi:MAG: hypothetical protein METHSR3v1_140001 [Methanothrix sp.]|nr:MAG: hypothetical protein METHSR3v1_140001 [Methanothrix sp.]